MAWRPPTVSSRKSYSPKEPIRVDLNTQVAAPRRRHRSSDPSRLGCAARPLRCALPGRARRFDDRRRPAVDPRGPRNVHQLAAVGRERVRPGLRRLPAARRPSGGPARTPPRLPDLARRLPRRVRAGWSRGRRLAADRDAIPQGSQRSLHGARGPLHHHHELRRGPRSQQGASPSTRRPERQDSRSASSSEGS